MVKGATFTDFVNKAGGGVSLGIGHWEFCRPRPRFVPRWFWRRWVGERWVMSDVDQLVKDALRSSYLLRKMVDDSSSDS